ncbi:MAG: amidohydrolase family protein, partial [Treponema sp.]|nr:amidohydrolase family protein [Treponema sp.]
MTLISGGYIIDGSGSPSFIGDLLFENEIILEIKKNGARTEKNHAIENSEEREIINAEGKIICPGFIDAHRHCDTAVFREGFGDLELKQGITTCVAGNCGMAPAPNTPETREQYENFLMPCLGPFPREKFSSHSEYVRLLQSAKLPLNIGFFAGMGALRVTAKGFDSSPYTKDEMKKARALLAEASFNGAFGLSIGLMYIPEFYSDADEIACLAKEIRGRGIIAAHMRHETNLLVSAVEEVIIIAKKAGIPLHISHFKAAGRGTWGRTLVRAIELIEKERAGGTDITVDFYPYDCGSSTLTQMIPPSYMSRGFEKAIAGLDKPDNIKWIRALLENG